MNAKEAKLLRTLLRVIRKYADEHNVRPISKMADEGLRLVRNLTEKKTNALIAVVTSVVLSFALSGSASTNVTLWASNGSGAVVNVASGSVAKVTSFNANIFQGIVAQATLTVSATNVANSVMIDYAQYSTNRATLPTVAGPAAISLYAYTANALVTVEISEPGALLSPANCVVIPSDSAGPVNIILESSTDMINWTPALPGTYGTSTAKRFFRIRGER